MTFEEHNNLCTTVNVQSQKVHRGWSSRSRRYAWENRVWPMRSLLSVCNSISTTEVAQGETTKVGLTECSILETHPSHPTCQSLWQWLARPWYRSVGWHFTAEIVELGPTLARITSNTNKAWLSEVCTIVPVACILWTSRANTNVAGGQRNKASTLQDCQSACKHNRQCTGLDWSANAEQGRRCWLTGPWSGTRYNDVALNVTHYDLDRSCPDPGNIHIF